MDPRDIKLLIFTIAVVFVLYKNFDADNLLENKWGEKPIKIIKTEKSQEDKKIVIREKTKTFESELMKLLSFIEEDNKTLPSGDRFVIDRISLDKKNKTIYVHCLVEDMKTINAQNFNAEVFKNEIIKGRCSYIRPYFKYHVHYVIYEIKAIDGTTSLIPFTKEECEGVNLNEDPSQLQ